MAVAAIVGLFWNERSKPRFPETESEIAIAKANDRKFIGRLSQVQTDTFTFNGGTRMTRPDGTEYFWYFHPGAKGTARGHSHTL